MAQLNLTLLPKKKKKKCDWLWHDVMDWELYFVGVNSFLCARRLG